MNQPANLHLVGAHKAGVETDVCGEPLVGSPGHMPGRRSEPVKYDLGDV